MSAYVFVGPTLPLEEARKELDAVYLPPACQGDVYRIARKNPSMIGIIDGYFERVPAVWHKEILWAMSQGIHVFGSASIGALRAAELAAFGMEGVGTIFQAYEQNELEDDDEVAVAHLPAEQDYEPASTAMVDIRATLASAESNGVVGRATHETFLRIAKALYYPERRFERILACAAAEGLPAQELKGLEAWLPSGQVDQKRNDAIEMLRQMRCRLESGFEPKQVRYHFEHTTLWEKARLTAGNADPAEHPQGGPLLLERVLDELRISGDKYRLTHQAALARCLSLDETWRQGIRPTAETVQHAAEQFRRENGLCEFTAFEQWMKQNHLSVEEFLELMEDEARLNWLEASAGLEVASHVPDHLRVSGEYEKLAGRALDKQHTLEICGLANPTLADAGLTYEELLRWYFQECLKRPIADDIPRYCRATGFVSEDAFRTSLLREFCYSSKNSAAQKRNPAAS